VVFEAIPLTFDMILVLGVLVLTVFFTLSNVIRVDVVALLVLVILGLTRLLEADQLFSGFSSDAVISLIAIMILSAGLEKSGVTLWVARWVMKWGHGYPTQTSFILMFIAASLSGFMRSLGTVSLLLPVVNKISLRNGMQKAQLLMPMCFCAMIGSNLSMIGSNALILLNSLLAASDEHFQAQGKTIVLESFSVLSIFPIGLVMLFVGMLYFIVLGKRLLPVGQSQSFSGGSAKKHFFKTYGKGTDVFELRVLPNSALMGQALQTVDSALDPTCSVLAVFSNKNMHFPPLRSMVVEKGDWLAIIGSKEQVSDFAKTYNLALEPKLKQFSERLHPVRAGLCEVVVPPSSQLIGLELRALHMKRNHHVHVLALYRGQTVYRGEALKSLVLHSGDTLGMFCNWEMLSDFHKNPDFVVVTTAYPREKIRQNKTGYALGFFALPLILIVFGHFPVPVGLLLGAAGMIATGVLNIDEAYESVSWKNVFLIAGLIPLGLAMQATHTSDWLTQYAVFLKDGMPLWGIQCVLAILSSLATFVLSAVGATIVLVPIAIDLALHMGVDPRLYGLIVAIASNNAFMMPNQQSNALIAGPGGYRQADFFRVGGGMSVLYLVTTLVMINLCFG
jgi:di/tricarboxylate transporter